jgi:hypothetical protein
MNAPELRIDIPMDHPWAQAIVGYSERPDLPSMYSQTGTMTFAGVRCTVRLIAIGELAFGRGMAPDHLKTTWKAQ